MRAVAEGLYPAGSVGTADFMAFVDLNPAAPDSQRDKGLSSSRGAGGIIGHVSPDGIHWQMIQDRPLMPRDTKLYDGALSPGAWDPHRRRYLAYLPAFAHGDGEEMPGSLPEAGEPNAAVPIDKCWRTVRHISSEDFIHWSEPVLLEFDPPLSLEEQLYTNRILPYFRAPHILIGLPKRFSPRRHKILEYPEIGVSDGGFMTSRDEFHWKRWGEAFIRPRLDPNNWTQRSNMPAAGVLQTGPAELSVGTLRRNSPCIGPSTPATDLTGSGGGRCAWMDSSPSRRGTVAANWSPNP